MIRLVPLLLAAAAVAWPQPARTPPPRTSLEQLQSAVEEAQRDWSQTNTIVLEAERRLSPCSPRLAALLVQVRENAAALARANARYLLAYTAELRGDLTGGRKFAAAASSGITDLAGAAAILNADRSLAESKRTQLAAGDPAGVAAALKNIEAATPGTAQSATDSRAIGQLLDAYQAKEKVIAQLEASAAAETRLWATYYQAIETGIRRRCATPAKPAVPPRRPR